MAGQMLPVGNFDKGGVVLDSDAFALAPSEWSGGRNVRFDNRSVSKISGEQELIDLGNANPDSLTHWKQPLSEYYVFTATNGSSHRASADGTVDTITKGAGGTPDPLILNNDRSNLHASLFNGGFTYLVADGVQIPQFLQANATTAELADLTGWGYDSTTYSSVVPQVIRPFKNVLVAGNLQYTNAGTNAITYAPGTIRVSDLAAPGALPTWDPSGDDSTTADEFELSETDGIVDMVSFQDQLLIFTRNSIFSMSLTGQTGTNSIPVRTSKRLEGRGMLSLNCGVEFYGRMFVVGQEDIYLYAGGSSVESVADDRVRDYFFDTFNGNLVFVQHNSRQDEMWVFFSKDASVTANEVLIWNYKNNVWTIRDADSVRAATYGSLVQSNTFTDTQGLVMGRNGSLLQADTGTSFSGNAINAYVERKGFDIAPNATNFAKWTEEVYILATGTGTVTVDIRATDSPGRPVDFDSNTDRLLKSRTFTLNGAMPDFKVDPRVNGRYFNIRFGSNDATSEWELIRYNLSFDTDDDGRG